jgi:hypothetical protein
MVTATVVLLMKWVNADLEQNNSVERCIKRRERMLRRQRRNGLESMDLMDEVYRAAGPKDGSGRSEQEMRWM